jgi:hypothetical protein
MPKSESISSSLIPAHKFEQTIQTEIHPMRATKKFSSSERKWRKKFQIFIFSRVTPFTARHGSTSGFAPMIKLANKNPHTTPETIWRVCMRHKLSRGRQNEL